MEQVTNIHFTNQRFFVGIDTHARQWTVTIRCNHIVLKTFCMNPSPQELSSHLNRNYPGGEYLSAYEAGFCGFWIHQELTRLGIRNIVVHAADVPTTDKEKDRKTDPLDSRKLARELEDNKLKSIYIPDLFHQQLRSLCRLRNEVTKNSTRVKNRIKGFLYYYGVPMPSQAEMSHWSNNFIQWLKQIPFDHAAGKDYLRLCVEELLEHRKRKTEILRLLRNHYQQYNLLKPVEWLRSVPGIGFPTAMSFYSELIDIKRFPNLNHLSSFFGLVESVHRSDTKDPDLGLTKRRNRFLRHLIIEAAWVAIRKDPVLLHKYNALTRRMVKQKAIIHIAKLLLNRIRFVWMNQTPYVTGVVTSN
jgi:transposase